MAMATRMTAFVTGAAGFVGAELVQVLIAQGHQVFGLVHSQEGAERVRRAGAVAVVGDLLEAGAWQDHAVADWVFHLGPHPLHGPRVTRRRAASIADARVRMDANLLDAVVAGSTRRVIYVSDASCYGPTGPRPLTEDEPRRPSAWGRRLTPALDRLDGYAIAGLPIVTAFPGWVYGNGSWFRDRVVDPILTGGRVLHFGARGPWISPIHVHDCARALVHLAERGEAGSRYFLVNNDPACLSDLPASFARLAGCRLRRWRIPRAAAPLVVGPILAEYIQADGVFSNIRLRGTGFRFRYHTVDAGLRQVLDVIGAPVS